MSHEEAEKSGILAGQVYNIYNGASIEYTKILDKIKQTKVIQISTIEWNREPSLIL